MQAISNNPMEAGVRAAAPSPAAAAAPRDAASVFAVPMTEAIEAAKLEAAKRSEELHMAAEQLVATTFIMPLFSQLRSDPMASDMFHGGRGEAIFQQQLDQILSDRISTGAGFDLVGTVAAYFEGRPSTAGAGTNLVDAARTRTHYDTAQPGGGVDIHG